MQISSTACVSVWQIIKYQFKVPSAQPYRNASLYIFVALAPVALVWQLRAANHALDAFPALTVIPLMAAMNQVFSVPVIAIIPSRVPIMLRNNILVRNGADGA